MSTPTGLTQEFDELSGTASADAHLLMYSGVVGVDCSPSDVISIGNPGSGQGNNYGAIMVTFRASDGSVPLFTHELDSLTAPGDDSPTAPTLAASTNGLLLFVAQAARSASGNTQTPPAGYSEIEEVNRPYICLMGATKDIAAAGATGAASSVSDAGDAAWVAAHVFVYGA